MIDDQSGAMEEEWPSEEEVLPCLEQIEEILLQNMGEQTEEILLQNTGEQREQTEEILPQKRGEQTVHICFSADVPEDSSDTSVGEKEVTQPSEPSDKQRSPQQLRQLEIIQKPSLEYVNAIIVEDGVNKPEIYKDVSQSSIWQKAIEEEIIAVEQNQTWELVPRSRDVKSIFCKWINREIQNSDCRSRVLSTIWTRL